MIHPMPRVPPFDRPATYDDLAALPDIVIAEIVDGELHSTPRPASKHARTYSALGIRIGGPFDQGIGGPGGWWIVDEPEVHLGANVLVPDLAGWRRARMPEYPDVAYFSIAPDWVCEILSPSTEKLDRTKKLSIYARGNVSHAWLVDPVGRVLEVYRLENRRWSLLGTHVDDEFVRAKPFAEIETHLSDLWAP
jgi:Uma2 family endonuclease